MLAVNRQRIKKIASDFSIWWILLVLALVMSAVSPAFTRADNLMSIFRQSVIVGIVTVGMTYAMICGNFDLSVGAVIALSGVLSISMQPVDAASTVLAIVVPLAAGLLVGIVNGVLIGYLKLNPFVTTLGMQFVVLGLTMIYTSGQHVWVFGSTPFYLAIGNGFVAGIPISVVIMVLLVAAGQWTLSKTRYGAKIRAVGLNARAAVLSGVKDSAVICSSFVLVSVCGAIAGVVLASWVKNMDPGSGIGYEFEVITAVVLGGTSLLGGKGNLFNSIAAVLILTIIINAMILLNISYNYQLMVRGIILISAIAIDVLTGRKSR